jgi:hypothetical protein
MANSFLTRIPSKPDIYIQASFFTSIDSVIFSLASSNKGNGSPTRKLMLASLVGALIFHAATGGNFEQNYCLTH